MCKSYKCADDVCSGIGVAAYSRYNLFRELVIVNEEFIRYNVHTYAIVRVDKMGHLVLIIANT
jgi:hypothetical protein